MGLWGSKPSEEMEEERDLSDQDQTNYEDEEEEQDLSDQDQTSRLEVEEDLGIDSAVDSVVRRFHMEMMTDYLHQFSDAIEPHFARAERRCVERSVFDLDFAKDFVLTLRSLGLRYAERGCTEADMEDVVLQRALITVEELVEGVKQRQEEVYDPHQTMIYFYCAFAVFPRSLRLEDGDGKMLFRLCPAASLCFPQLEILDTYCVIKSDCGNLDGWNEYLQCRKILVEFASWLELERACISHLISSRTFSILMSFLSTRNWPSQHLVKNLVKVKDEAVVVAVSSLIQEDFVEEASKWRKHLAKVDRDDLSECLAVRLHYIQACLLHNCRQFENALAQAMEARRTVSDPEMRRKIDQIICHVSNAIENSQRAEGAGSFDSQWLVGTSAGRDERSSQERQEAAKEAHRAQRSRKKSKKKAVHRRGESPFVAPSRSDPAACPEPSEGRSRKPTSARSSPSLGSSSDLSTATGPTSSQPDFSRWLDDSEEEEEDEEEDLERDIHFVDESDFEDDGYIVPAVEDRGVLLRGEEADQLSWFEDSERLWEEQGFVDEESEVQISSEQADNFGRGGEGRSFYSALWKHGEAVNLLSRDPDKYKRCQLKIEGAHKAIAKVLDKDSKFSEILISGRSKAGQTYMDDEVVVEVLKEPGSYGMPQQVTVNSTNTDLMEKMAHGKVVGLLKRNNFEGVEHPVLFCTLDEIEGHLMRPLCKTVPKIHVLNDTVRRKYPSLLKSRIEIKDVSSGNVNHKGYCDVPPHKREQYLFRVVILAWRSSNIYPLGAVLEAHISGRNYSGGLEVLSLQHRVPRWYPRSVLEETKNVSPPTDRGRADRRGERIFTIDPPDSKDLDDAVSIRKQGTHHIVGVHIADVASVLRKDSGIDDEARRRAVTFYPLKRRPHAMLPEPLSHGVCSLLPGEERAAISVYFRFNSQGKLAEEEPEVERSIIRSCQQLTYKQAQNAIDNNPDVDMDPEICSDIQQLHAFTSKLRENRMRESTFFIPFDDPRLSQREDIDQNIQAHALIEELMILTNSYIARRLTRNTRLRDLMVIRSHAAPTDAELAEWHEKVGPIASVVLQLQGKRVGPDRRLSLNERLTLGNTPSQRQQHVLVQNEVWSRLSYFLEEGNIAEARRLACMDALHPLQCLANNDWMDLMESAQYRCNYGLSRADQRHFGLDLDVYTHFTSPIRRYSDIHVQRLLHADLDGSAPDGSIEEVIELCQHMNSAIRRQKAFGKGCQSLQVAESLQSQPLIFRAFVRNVDADQLTLCLPSLLALSDRKQELPFSVLGVNSQPEVTTDTALRQDSVVVQWKKRVYDVTGTCPSELRPVWSSAERQAGRNSVLYINPDQAYKTLSVSAWLRILQQLLSNPEPERVDAPLPVVRHRRPACAVGQRDYIAVEYMSCEKGDNTVSIRPVCFKRMYCQGQVLQLQMSAEPRKGLLEPRAELLHTSRNSCVCTRHVSEPVLTLSRFATRSTRDQNFGSYKAYMQAWMPLLEMEAAAGAGNTDTSIVINQVAVTLRRQTESAAVRYRGSFTLQGAFCFDRRIAFGDSGDKGETDQNRKDNAFPLDYLCLRYQTNCSSTVVSRVRQSPTSETVDKKYTWLAHASIVDVAHKKRKARDGGYYDVTFALSPSSPQPPEQLLSRDGEKVTVEILPKSEVDRRAQQVIIDLKDPRLELAHAIAYGRDIPKLDSDHKKLGKLDENHEVQIPESRRLPKSNSPQYKAIKTSMTHSLSIIQGPPGSGKTNTGVKLVYLFCKVNRQLQADGKGRKTVLYCGPSNKSVDLVARELKAKLLTECPKIVRVYGSAIEEKDYPVPGSDLRSTRGARDLKCDPYLQDIALHHLIRQSDKPYAEEIAEMEKYFDLCRNEPQQYTLTSKRMRSYRNLLYEASVEELKHHEVILSTCAVGGNRKIREGTDQSIFQLIIDECAMSPEPHSLVPIVATKAKQVVLIGDHKQLRPIIQCQPAAELGLDQSLFERIFLKYPSYTTFLSTQYRMHPEICAFPSKEFYDGELKTGYSGLWGGELLPFWPTNPFGRQVPHLIVDVRGEEETLTVNTDQGNERSKSNSLEAEKVIEILTYLKTVHRVDMLKIKILTQYNAQRHLIEEKLKTAIEENRNVARGRSNIFEHYDKHKINVSTVVSSQGGEWDYVILSTVRSLPSYKIETNPTHGWCRQNLGFITDRNQVNVAITRARRGLFIVGNVQLLQCDDVWRHLVERYESLGCCFNDLRPFPPPLPPVPARPVRQNRLQNAVRF